MGEAFLFPSVAATRPDWPNRFGCKGGAFASPGPLGVKIGSYWPGNAAHSVPNHGSTTLLLDEASGHPIALIRATYLNALRTAAADAVAVRHLAREDATTLGVVGAGHQAWFEIAAIRAVRPVNQVRIWSRSADKAELLADRLTREDGLAASAATLEEACASDIVVTVTAARSALVDQSLILPGTHLSAMGSDGPGKVELDTRLLTRARLFADVVAQSLTLGEFEQAHLAGLISSDDITTLGSVIAGRKAGRTSNDQVTIFDSSGIALQDLAIAQFALETAIARDQAIILQ